ncbi:Leucine Rich Repeat [Seminavis robusta]|uniref:Leucine Rich Repeat n=1 Tax=Seminavis robusta TaxID=568900 RepID=A0A9N8H9L1_9STRA|nr:Leucine Rich Repeat [Seminavis robusta]|eukprot:Sro280_g107120.1 Leucine Rich Repeat (697) ;mRNA; f:65419-67509
MYPSLRQIDGSSVKADGTAEATVVKISAATTTEEKAKLANAASMPSPATSHGRKRCSAGRDRAGLAAQPTWEDYKLVTGHHPVLSEMLRTSRQDSRDHDVVRDLPELAKDDDVTDPLELPKDTATFAPSRNNQAPEPPSTQAGAYSETPGQNAVRLEKTRVYRNMTPHNPTSVDILETDTPAEQASVHDDVDLEEGMSVSQRDREMYSQGSVTQEAADRDLLEAIPVADNDATVSQELGIATPMQSTEGERLELQKRHLLLRTSVTVFVMLLAVVGITLIILHSVLGREEENPTRAPEQDAANATESTTRLVKGLPDYSVEAILKDSTSPQARANQWLLNDPSLHNYTKNRIIQRFALATLFYSTNPPHLYEDLAPSLSMTSSWSQDRNWLSYDHHECEWFGRTQFHWYQQTIDLPVTIDKPCTDDGAHHALWLSDNNLIGSLPLEIFGLSTLNSIDVQRNPLLGGSIPSQIGLLSSLSLFSCANSSMTGTLPTELGLLTDAKQVALHVMFTTISGRLPSELGSVSNLERVMLGYNQITGSIPSEIGRATAIRTLNLAGNRLSGSLPTELAQLSVLRYLWLQDNQISGSLATELGRLSSAWSITLQNNLLSGPLPSELGNLEKLFELRLRGNDLAGSIPESWTNLVGFNGSLQELDITDTLLTGRFEEEWCALNGGFVFDCVPSMLCGCGECQCSD